MQRSNDTRSKRYFRSERLFNVNSQWFFMTRETQQEGPFTTRAEAEDALRRYVDLMCSKLGQLASKRFREMSMQ